MTTLEFIRLMMEGTGWVVYLIFATFAVFLTALVIADRLQAWRLARLNAELDRQAAEFAAKWEGPPELRMTRQEIDEMNRLDWR